MFWNDEPDLFWDYVVVHKDRLEQEAKNEFDKLDYHAWLMGSYMIRALATFGIMVKKPVDYPKEPHSYSRREKDERKKTTQQVEKSPLEQQTELLRALMSYNKRGG